MKVIISKGNLKGEVFAPPSKSYAHRYLIAAMLSGGTSKVSNVYLSEDISATAGCLKSMGYAVNINGSEITVEDGIAATNHPVLNAGESGSTLRFLIPVALTKFDSVTFTGTKRLFQRGLSVYEEIARRQGIQFSYTENSVTFCGRLKAGFFEVPGNISSQYITGLLFALSALKEESIIKVIPPVESKPYIDITLDVLKNSGVNVTCCDNVFTVGGSKYSAKDSVVEGDYSNAAFLDAFNYLGGNVNVKGLKADSLQGDRVYSDYFERINKGFCSIDISDAIDLGPVLFAFAALKNGALFTGTARLKIKESDRAAAMGEQLAKIGVRMEIGEDTVTVHPISAVPTEKIEFCGMGDHRIVMALSLMMTVSDIAIDGAEAIAKSFPDYFEKLKDLGASLQYVDQQKQ